MENLNSPQYIRYFKTFVAAILLSATVVSFPTNKALGNNMQRVSQKVSQLKNSNKRWIQVDLSEQRLIAWEGNKAVFGVTVSTGKRSTPTPIGVFNIYTKLKQTRMKGDGYDIPDVPHTMYYQGGYGIHGAYWHNNFGTPVSHGCVNLAPNQAKKLFNWASVGTTVVVQR
ncbi:L,D-transpeptidase [Plectonema cf. radiosum LEGE 06105]|uniref:L,D-transpeptidase n=1 Tax=Plectonema cf. radiosum LEGE 06105 TaxID=945769 RepID=A0A8J7EZP8_9CYAN|nr:L,D-transpeptidase [Plectonema radiosum]MBE9213186.1 L,D-transpeptidase [Plectonema cf. radiosum LEGE 06105]